MSARLISGSAGPVSVDHERGRPPVASFRVDRGLSSGKLDEVVLDERELLALIESAAVALRVLRSRP